MWYHGLLDNERADSTVLVEVNLRCSAIRLGLSRSSEGTHRNRRFLNQIW